MKEEYKRKTANRGRGYRMEGWLDRVQGKREDGKGARKRGK